ncbi:abortive infection protein [Ktedonosporobacter rubrisoli]|uniref:Abortive infection protein n=1 Tax=Ktedonosporobacter rubrisoli TaxID=2509675 RepID=A0A4P6JZE5_KTERU|nr:abortive infection protein [Ktedonosporobacter rubrisoli]QBD81129.1 abortive infection protein [Ktedonosporobacter rubrisoli]
MKRNGVCYDVGRVMMGDNWRPVLDPHILRRELEIIRQDLHCNAVRICGLDLERLMLASEEALKQGLEVWLSPEMWDRSQAETLDHLSRVALAAEQLRKAFPQRLILSVGSELTLFMQGIVEGNSFLERLHNPAMWEQIKAGAHNGPLNAFLRKANEAVRAVFRGQLTYFSVPLETVDWSPFDFVGVDMYREARIREKYGDLLKRYLGYGKPLIIGEFGCCTYQGAEQAGGRGWDILDFTASPLQLNGTYVRDEALQARELSEMLAILENVGVEGAFVFTFVTPTFPTHEDARYDLDMASYSLVKSLANGCGTRYPELPWEPKEAFAAVAEYYRLHQVR